MRLWCIKETMEQGEGGRGYCLPDISCTRNNGTDDSRDQGYYTALETENIGQERTVRKGKGSNLCCSKYRKPQDKRVKKGKGSILCIVNTVNPRTRQDGQER
jgi:hypothetical protein